MDITLIGAGPRGLITAERLIEWQKKTSQYDKLAITLLDPFGIGGRVWQVDQPHELLMNTNPDYITLFTDETIAMTGPVVTGPNLFEWAHQDAPGFLFSHRLPNRATLLEEAAALKHNGYASRSLFGVYQVWFYEYLEHQLPESVTLSVVQETATSIRQLDESNRYLIKTDTNRAQADAVIMALGHHENDLTPEQTTLMNFADEHNLNYIGPTQPQEYQFQTVNAGQNVILRGLGLNFFDAVTLLTQGRGGHFTKDTHGRLVYHPSGIEPHIIAGSRRGFPLRAKGRNEKGYGELDKPHFLTPDWFEHYQTTGSLSGSRLIELLHHEAEYVYYERLLKLKYPQVNADEFLNEFVHAQRPEAIVFRSAIVESDYFNWDKLLNPGEFMENSEQPQVMADYLESDVTAALAGTKTGPLTSALEIFRDLRDVIRRVVDQQLLRPDDLRNLFLGQFDNENSYLSVGPPETRIAELQALVEAGIVTILGPSMTVDVDVDQHQFVTWSKHFPEDRYNAKCLVEARLPAISAAHSQNPLIQNLLTSDLAQAQTVPLSDGTVFATGAVDIDIATSQLQTDDEIVSGLYFWGVPTEGKRWFTTASPRPGVNDSVLRGGDGIVANIFKQFTD
ncbi:FAD/NAD(P)-binding protein [Furfurilactobacillus siliginis]|uniref:FAD(NAD)-dependent oxidoreductase n=1 Tax=Furfurilactobacillus siliginis TaxID=348151 RepID=A0A0R2LBJ3_9LACO|nr:FAD/NAD(P)-binding protein [Furfurilactobacillus siliginis]KRN97141.1 FAD(NAD)-dependent oxidoreductase [Furfurilactobacillus siliginis]GEK28806.1 FAD-dependent oxidoreductase [Furfurilactobacillus siliginis]